MVETDFLLMAEILLGTVKLYYEWLEFYYER